MRSSKSPQRPVVSRPLSAGTGFPSDGQPLGGWRAGASNPGGRNRRYDRIRIRVLLAPRSLSSGEGGRASLGRLLPYNQQKRLRREGR